MASKVFRNTRELERYSRKMAAKILQGEVARKAEEVLIDCIEEAYNQYITQADRPYERRYANGGLLDRKTIKKYISNDGLSIRIRQEAQSDYGGKYLVDVYVTRGDLYNWKNSQIYKDQPFPRDFYEYAKKDFQKKIFKIVQKEFSKYGIKSEKITVSVR